MKYNNCSFVLTMSLIIPQLLWAPPLGPEKLAPLARVIKPHASSLSLATGKAYLPYARNLYEFGSDESPLVQLTRDPKVGLFNVNAAAFRASQYAGSPALVLQGSLAGKVLAGITTQKLFEKQFETDLTHYWRDFYKRTFPKGRLPQASTPRIIDLFKKSHEELHKPDSIFLPSTLPALLMAHQVIKEQPQEDRTAMYKELENYGLLESSEVKENDYTLEDFENFKNQIFSLPSPEEQAALITKNPDLAIATEKYLESFDSDLPPAPQQAAFCYKNNPSTPNCVETGLHDLVNLLVFDPETRTFNPQEMLPSTIKVTPSLIEFYKKFPASTETTITDARQDWFNLVSGLPTIEYNKSEQEVNPNFENQLKVLNHLLGTNALSFEELGKQLSTNTRSVIFNHKHIQKENLKTYGNIELILPYSKRKLLLKSNPQHAYLERENINNAQVSLFSEEIQKILGKENNPILTSFLPFFNPEKYQYYLYKNPHLLTYNANLTNSNILLNQLKKISDRLDYIASKGKHSEVIEKIILPSLVKLPLDDFYFIYESIQILDTCREYCPPKNTFLAQKINNLAEKIAAENISSLLALPSSISKSYHKKIIQLLLRLQRFIISPELTQQLTIIYKEECQRDIVNAFESVYWKGTSSELISFLELYLSPDNFPKISEEISKYSRFFKDITRKKTIPEILQLLDTWPPKITLLYLSTIGLSDILSRNEYRQKDFIEQSNLNEKVLVTIPKKYQELAKNLPDFGPLPDLFATEQLHTSEKKYLIQNLMNTLIKYSLSKQENILLTKYPHLLTYIIRFLNVETEDILKLSKTLEDNYLSIPRNITAKDISQFWTVVTHAYLQQESNLSKKQLSSLIGGIKIMISKIKDIDFESQTTKEAIQTRLEQELEALVPELKREEVSPAIQNISVPNTPQFIDSIPEQKAAVIQESQAPLKELAKEDTAPVVVQTQELPNPSASLSTPGITSSVSPMPTPPRAPSTSTSPSTLFTRLKTLLLSNKKN